MAKFDEYLKALKSKNFTYGVYIELLDDSETLALPIWVDVFESSGSLKITLQNGMRRSFSLILDNSKRLYDIDVNKLWIYQKLRLYIGIQYINSEGKSDIFLQPQGVFYINNPSNSYSPSEKTISLECVDKWKRIDDYTLDATCSFPKSYKDSSGVITKYEYDMFDIIRNLLKTPLHAYRIIAYVPENIINTSQLNATINTFLSNNSFDLYKIKYSEAVVDNKNKVIYYCSNRPNSNTLPTWSQYIPEPNKVIDEVEPMLSNSHYTEDTLKNKRVLLPYSLTKDMGSSIKEIFVELAKILNANIYYDRVGRLVLDDPNYEDNIQDNFKEVIWEFDELNSTELYDIKINHNFDNAYNIVTCKGSLVDVGDYTVTVSNNDAKSPMNVGRIGRKLKTLDDVPIYDYKEFVTPTFTEAQAIEECKRQLTNYAKTQLKKYTVLETKVNIKCMTIPHLDVDKVISIRFKDGSYSKYLIQSIEMPLSGVDSMSLECSAIFDVDISVE